MNKRIDPEQLDLKEKVVHINRVAKVVKGGKRFSFSALIVVGDGHGYVGVGLGKANEVPESIKKGVEDAKKNLILVPLIGTTVPQKVEGYFGAAKVMIKPAAPGTGVIAGGSVRAIMEMAGVHDVVTKIFGTNNAHNVIKATILGLKILKYPEDIARLRGKNSDPVAGTTSSTGVK